MHATAMVAPVSVTPYAEAQAPTVFAWVPFVSALVPVVAFLLVLVPCALVLADDARSELAQQLPEDACHAFVPSGAVACYCVSGQLQRHRDSQHNRAGFGLPVTAVNACYELVAMCDCCALEK